MLANLQETESQNVKKAITKIRISEKLNIDTGSQRGTISARRYFRGSG